MPVERAEGLQQDGRVRGSVVPQTPIHEPVIHDDPYAPSDEVVVS